MIMMLFMKITDSPFISPTPVHSVQRGNCIIQLNAKCLEIESSEEQDFLRTTVFGEELKSGSGIAGSELGLYIKTFMRTGGSRVRLLCKPGEALLGGGI